jgi:hypothetical protein
LPSQQGQALAGVSDQGHTSKQPPQIGMDAVRPNHQVKFPAGSIRKLNLDTVFLRMQGSNAGIQLDRELFLDGLIKHSLQIAAHEVEVAKIQQLAKLLDAEAGAGMALGIYIAQCCNRVMPG